MTARPVALLSAAALVALATGALAHAFVDHATPAVGSTVHGSPPDVRIWLTEQLEPAFSSIKVEDSGGGVIASSDKAVDASDATLLRAVSDTAAMLMLGAALFAVYAPPRVERGIAARLQAGSAIAALLSTGMWLAVHSAVVSGQPVTELDAIEALLVAVRYTKSGHVGAFRLLLVVLFLLVPAKKPGLRVAFAVLSTGALAWSGHAVGTPG